MCSSDLGGFDLKFLGVMISARTPQRLLMQFSLSLVLLLVLSPRARMESIRIARSPIFLALALTVLAMWLSLGPIPKAGDSLVSGFGLYNVLYDYVPGFNGVRAPARYAMIAGMYLAVLASMIHGFTVPASIEVAMRAKGYTRGLFGWLTHAPHLGVSHWELRHAIVLPMALAIAAVASPTAEPQRRLPAGPACPVPAPRPHRRPRRGRSTRPTASSSRKMRTKQKKQYVKPIPAS